VHFELNQLNQKLLLLLLLLLSILMLLSSPLLNPYSYAGCPITANNTRSNTLESKYRAYNSCRFFSLMLYVLMYNLADPDGCAV